MTRARALLFTCLALALTVQVAQAQSLAFAPDRRAAFPGARGAVSVDLNRDGWLDIATANTGRNTVVLLINRGAAGGFEAPREIRVGSGPFDIAAGDLNRDSIPDLVVATPDSFEIHVLLFGPNATVAAHHAVGGTSRGLTLADVTRDGRLDLVFTHYNQNRVLVYPGDGAGGFRPDVAAYPVSSRPQGIVAADFNHDGFVDLAVASTNGITLDVLYGTSSGFTRRTVSAGRTLNVLAAADINADGWLDLAAAASATDVVSFFKGTPTGFVLAGTRAVGVSPRVIASGDFNHDGRPDFAVGNRASNSVTVLVARRDGSVLPDRWGELPTESGARPVVAGDFDHDGRNDLAVATEFSSAVFVFANDTAFVRAGFSFVRQPMLSDGSSEDVAVADFNENGHPDLLERNGVVLDGATFVPLNIRKNAGVMDVAAADVNLDGHMDAVIGLRHVDEAFNSIFEGFEVHLGDGRGGFTFAIGSGGMVGLSTIRVADVDRDGDVDVVAIGLPPSGTRIYVYTQLGIGGGGWRHDEYPFDGRINAFDLADVNRDGILDLVLARESPAVLSVRFGDGAGRFTGGTDTGIRSGVPFAMGDVDRDGRVDVVMPADVGSVVVMLGIGDGQWQTPAMYPAFAPGSSSFFVGHVQLGDFNQDGEVDVFAGNGALLPGIGGGRLGTAEEFEVVAFAALAVDWNTDGLLDLVGAIEAVLNERRAENRPPPAIAGPDRTIEYQNQFKVEGTILSGEEAPDPDAHRVSYEWRDPDGKALDRAIVTSFDSRPPGTYIYTLIARDGRGGEGRDTVQITITPSPEIVLWSVGGFGPVGNWRHVDDTTAAGGARMFYPNAGAPKVTTALANPSSYVDLTVAPDPTQTYKLWVRLKAQDNRGSNDSIWVQMSGAVDTTGQPDYRIGTTEGLEVNLEECLGCGVSGWGWEDDGWGAVNKNGTLLRFPSGGVQRIRIQVREDGVSVDQVVLSAVKYRTARPGAAKNDTTILPITFFFDP